jgi:hypothetical protein
MTDAVDKLMAELRSACAKEQVVRSHHVIYAQEAIAFLRAELEQTIKRAEENNDHKTGLRRMWINQPSTLQTLHKLHGERVLAAPGTEGTHRVYFVRGSIVSMQVPYHVLSAGWPTRSELDGKVHKFRLGERVTKVKGSKWTGRVVGFYSTALTPVGYAVESETEIGSVQIYPEAALTGAKP